MRVLGIETSCDDTAVAIVQDDRKILAQHIVSQHDQHAQHGGIVPSIAARAHEQHLSMAIQHVLQSAHLTLNHVDAIAVTAGPGLIGGLLVGVMMAKSLALAWSKPLYPIHHLWGHALSPRLMHANLSFPFLVLLVSGGHCQSVLVKNVNDAHILGYTRDDAPGECFDKIARLLHLGYPGGPDVEKHAARGVRGRFKLTVPLQSKDTCDFSFSGLKTAVRQLVQDHHIIQNEQDVCDLCADVQHVIGLTFIQGIKRALRRIHAQYHVKISTVVMAGGVAANQSLRHMLRQSLSADLELIVPDPKLCTDNAAMIAWAAIEGIRSNSMQSTLNFHARSRWEMAPFAMN